MSYFYTKKVKILNKLTTEIWDIEGYIDGLTDSKDRMNKEKMKIIKLKELYHKIDNINEEI